MWLAIFLMPAVNIRHTEEEKEEEDEGKNARWERKTNKMKTFFCTLYYTTLLLLFIATIFVTSYGYTRVKSC